MKMERFSYLFSLSAPCAICLLLMLTGCHLQKTYRYEDIQAEYAESARIRPLSAAETPQETRNPEGPVSLAEAINIALENNPENHMAVARIAQAEAAIRQSNAAFFPALGFYTEYTHADAPSVYLFKKIDQRELPPNTDFNAPGELNNFESGLTGRINLFNGGRDYLRRRMAQTGLTISRLDRESVVNAMIASVINAYYDVLAAREFIQIARDSVTTVQKELELMRVRLRGGSVLKSDVLSLEVRLAESEEELVRSRNRHQTALTALAAVMGIDPDREPVIEAPVGFPSASIPQKYDQGLAFALARRPDLIQVRERVRQSAMAADAVRGEYLPRVDLQGKYYLDDENMKYDADRDNWMAAVILNWDLFTGFSTRAAAEAASARLAETLAADRNAELSVKVDVRNAYLNLEEAGARLEVARRSMDASKESLTLVLKQFEGGSATITRYLQTELDRNRARIRAAAAYYDRQKALAEIGRAIGYWAKTLGRPGT